MTCAIVYSSRTGNTKQLAEAVRASLGEQTCLYMGPPDDRALAADRLYVGFWTDKGTCDAATAGFLSKVSGKEVFLFGTAGFGGEPAYFESILSRVAQCLGQGNTLIGSFMCQGPHAYGSAGTVRKNVLRPVFARDARSEKNA